MDVTRCSRLTPVMTSQLDTQLTAATLTITSAALLWPHMSHVTLPCHACHAHHSPQSWVLVLVTASHWPELTDVLLTRSLCQD